MKAPRLNPAHGATARLGSHLATTELPARDEMPEGVPAPAGLDGAGNRDAGGRYVPGEATREAARRAANCLAEDRRLARLLGLVQLPEGHPVAPYRAAAAEWRDAHLARLAERIGGGDVGPGPALIVSEAATTHAAHLWLSDKAAMEQDVDLAIKAAGLVNTVRAALRDAHALAALEAQSKPRRDPLDLLNARLDAMTPKEPTK